MKTYRVMHRETKDERMVDANCAADACKQMGWLIGDCHVREIRTLSSEEVRDIEAEKQASHYERFARNANKGDQ